MTTTRAQTEHKRVLLLALLFAGTAALVMAGTADAQYYGNKNGGAAKKGKWHRGKHRGKHRGMRLKRMFSRLDNNNDGLLSKAEIAGVPARRMRMLAKADSNKDGFISKAELRAAFKKFRKRRRNMRIRRMFKRLDADNSGTLTKNEIANAPRRLARFLTRADANSDGVITKAELRAAKRKFRRHHRGKHKRGGWHKRGGPSL